MLGIGVILAVWFDWLSGVFPQAGRGRAFGTAFGASSVLNFAGGLIAGRLLALPERVPSFSILYLGAAACGTASILTFFLIDDPNRHARGDGRRLRLADMVRWFRLSLADPNFRSFLVGRMLAMAGFCIVPFVALHYTSPAGGGLAAARVVTLGVFVPAGALLSNLAFGWTGDRWGHRIGITAGAGLQMLAIALLLLVTGPAGCAAVYFVIGLCGGAGGVSHHNMIFETCPHDDRLSHITIANLALSAGVVFPLLAGVVVHSLGLRALLVASLAVSAAALLWYLLKVRDPRRAVPGGA
jgi:MFS family permease